MFEKQPSKQRHCTKIDIKPTMRPLLGQRIVPFISKKGRNLKGQLLLPGVLGLTLTLSSTGEQGDILSYCSEDVAEEQTESEMETEVQNNENRTKTPDLPPKGLIYARVSSSKQLKGEGDKEGRSGYDEGSIEGQVEELVELAENEGIKLPYDPITDKAKTGTNFDRAGIQRVFEVVQREEIDYLLVEKVDRIGRSAAETLYFIHHLQSKYGVTLLTPSGEHDVDNVEGLMQTTLLSLMAEVQNDIRTTKAKKERIRGFLHKKKWTCKSPKIPLGYNETDDGWLEIDPDESTIVRDLFRKFVECESYAETERYIDKQYGPSALDGHSLKTLLTNGVYIGKPRLPEEWTTETTYKNELDDQSINIFENHEISAIDVGEDTFDKAQEITREISNKYSTDDDTEEMSDFIEEFSLFAVTEGSEPAALLHHCGEPLRKDGQQTLNGRKVHRYRCPNCEESVDAESYYRQWPREYELWQIQLIQEILDGDSTLFES